MPEKVRDYYGLLGVRKDATGEEIKRAYRKLARELHPDVNPDAAAQERFKEITVAYEVLSDPEKRRMVDLGGDPFGGGGGAGAGFPPGFGGGLGDVFDMFFGGAQQRGPRSRARAGADALLRLDLTLAEIASGVHRDLTVDTAITCDTCGGDGCAPGTSPTTCDTCGGVGEVQSVQRTLLGQMMTTRACPVCSGTGQVIPSPCLTCGGDGRVRARRTIGVDVPGGIEDGMRIRLTGRGEVGPGGGPAGDLYIEIHEQPHDVYSREGDDLHATVSVPMTAAALGSRVSLPGLDAEPNAHTVEIKAGTQNDNVVTLRGRGMPRLHSTHRGDLHVHLSVSTPSKLDAEQERLLREFAELRDEHVAVGSPRGGGFLGKMRDAFNGR
ncbi:MAG: molecular chaperone DnaJ [Jatrophihabitans sp.]